MDQFQQQAQRKMNNNVRRLSILQSHINPTPQQQQQEQDTIELNSVNATATVQEDVEFAGSLTAERNQSSLNKQDIRQITHVLDGGADITQLKEYTMRMIERDPIYAQVDNYDKTLPEHRVISMQKARKGASFWQNIMDELERIGVSSERREIAERHVWGLLSVSDPGTFTRLGVHTGLFLNAIKGQGHDSLREKVEPLASSLKIYGCFAMTEMGHGSYLRGLETTATFDEKRDEFIINSPTETATKWWIGGAAHSATHAVVFAQLIIKGKNYGPHSFFVQLRDLEKHELMTGISAGDIGKKMGRDTIDNGWIQFTNVRIPRDNMLMKWAKVSRSGEYSAPPLAQLAYGAVIQARTDIVNQSSVDLQRALTIAIRYGCVRRQFHNTSRRAETKLMDYQTHQYRLLPYLTSAFAMSFTAARLNNLYQETTAELDKGIVSSKLADAHNLSAGLKAFTTWITFAGIESCRQACGGHGYSSYSGFAQILTDFAVQCTWDGDNTVLAQQTSRYLLKTMMAASSGKTKPDVKSTSVAYLTEFMDVLSSQCTAEKPDDFSNPELQLAALRYKSTKLLANASLRVKQESGTKKIGLAWNECQVDLIACAKAHCYLYMGESFIKAANNSSLSPSVQKVLKNLCDLFILHVVIEQDATILMAENYMSSEQYTMLSDKVRSLMKEVRRDVIPIVDGFNLTDFLVNSPLGSYDGQVYQKYFDRVKKANPPGSKAPYYEQLIQTMIDPTVQKQLTP